MAYPVSDAILLEKYGHILDDKALCKIANWILPNCESEFDEGEYLDNALDERNLESFAKVVDEAIKDIRAR